jgi:phage FluMu protein Com
MPIEILCSNCQALLRVADEHAGKNARCPQCSTIVPIPSKPGLQATEFERTDSSMPPAADKSPTSATPSESFNPYAAPSRDYPQTPPRVGRNLRRHRGETILVMGIVSLVCCPLLGIFAIIMANGDLRQMDNGTMDPSGQGLTQAGRIIAIVSLIFSALGCAFNLLVFAAAEM